MSDIRDIQQNKIRIQKIIRQKRADVDITHKQVGEKNDR